LATVVAIITSMVVANATQSITTPNAAFVSYSLAAGANSAAITPATNRSVLVMGCVTTIADAGVSQLSLLHIPSTGIFWVGLGSSSSNATVITSGSSNTAGSHIVFIDFDDLVEIQTASADAILIHNRTGNITVAGNVTLVW